MFLGWVFIIFGLAFLLQNLGILPGNVWDYLWPLILIGFGLSFLKKRSGSGGCWCCGTGKSSEKNNSNTS